MRLIDADNFELVKTDLQSHLDEGFVDGANYILDMIDEAPTVNQWTSIKDGLPKKGCQCLCVCKGLWTRNSTIYMLRFDTKSKKFYDFNYSWMWIEHEVSNVTHWMELPKPPKGN